MLQANLAPMSTPCQLSIKDAPRTVNEGEEKRNVPYKQILGCIRYLVSCTCPNLSLTELEFFQNLCKTPDLNSRKC